MTRIRVLVVDDSATIRRVVTQALVQAGYDVSQADGGESGLREVRAVQPHLILLDFMMPGMNGYQFVKALDAEDAGQVPIVMMSTRADALPAEALRRLGVLDTVTKPFSPETIPLVVDNALKKHGNKKDQREETTRVTNALLPPPLPMSDESAALDEPPADDAVTRPVLFQPPSAPRSTPPEEPPLRRLARVLADALSARGVDDADGMATTVVEQLRDADLGPTLVDAVQRPQLSLTGDLGAVPLPEVLQLLKFQGQTGLLEVGLEGANPARFEVGFKNGSVVSIRARNVRADLLLGHYFVGHGYVTQEQLDEVLTVPSSAPLGQRLLDASFISPEQLRRCVGAQTQDLMYELLRARNGFFGLRRGDDVLPPTLIAPGISVDALLFEGLRRIDEWSVIEKEVPSFDARFVALSTDETRLAPDESAVLRMFAKESVLAVREVIALTNLPAFEACKVLYRLTVLKRLSRIEEPPPLPRGPA